MVGPANDNRLMDDPDRIASPSLTSDEFHAIQRQLGLTDRALAANLGLSPTNGHTVIRRIKNGEPCSGPIATAMVAFATGFRPAWYRQEHVIDNRRA